MERKIKIQKWDTNILITGIMDKDKRYLMILPPEKFQQGLYAIPEENVCTIIDDTIKFVSEYDYVEVHGIIKIFGKDLPAYSDGLERTNILPFKF